MSISHADTGACGWCVAQERALEDSFFDSLAAKDKAKGESDKTIRTNSPWKMKAKVCPCPCECPDLV
jgi:hypothetical protein